MKVVAGKPTSPWSLRVAGLIPLLTSVCFPVRPLTVTAAGTDTVQSTVTDTR